MFQMNCLTRTSKDITWGFFLWAFLPFFHKYKINGQSKGEGIKANDERRITSMHYVKALLLKWVMVTAILWIVLGGFFGVSFINIFTIGVLVTGISYLVGDLLILSRSENWVATIADFVLTFAIVWLVGAMLFAPIVPLATASFMSALIEIGRASCRESRSLRAGVRHCDL